jgi:molybdopterin-guanine dinucleotide biosynthesis protein A
MMIENISAAVLAGGENSRFGGIVKSNAFIGGRRIIDRIGDTICGIFDEVILVTSKPEELQVSREIKSVSDCITGKGPLGGIHAALINTSKTAVFVFAGDMPFLHEQVIRYQVKLFMETDCEALIPVSENGFEPLHAIYRTSVAAGLRNYLQSTDNYSVKGFTEKINSVYFNPQLTVDFPLSFTNINTPSEASDADKESGKEDRGSR